MKEVLLKRFASKMEAELAKNTLAAHGIHSLIQSRIVGYHGGQEDGGDLFVLEKDVKTAQEVLNITTIPESSYRKVSSFEKVWALITIAFLAYYLINSILK